MTPRSKRLVQVLQFGLVFFTVTLAGITCLPQPFDGDQALFSMGAEQWAAGDVYFRDFWDLKPPGIYMFYYAAGSLCGFDEVGIHLCELFWSMALAILLTIATRRWYKTGIARVAVPLMTVGVYHCIADTWHLTQIEWLVSLPLFVSLWCMSPASATQMPPASAFLIAGLCGGIIGLCKPMYGLIPAAFWLCAIVLNPADGIRMRLQMAVTRGLVFATGVFIPLAAMAWYFYRHDALEIAIRTMFEYPPKVLAMKDGGYENLLQGLKWCALMAGPLIAPAVIGSILAVRKGRSAFSVSLVTWFVTGLILVLAQGMWWEYHFLLVLVPLALLALKAMETLLLEMERLQPRLTTMPNRMLVISCIAMAFLAYPAILVDRAVWLRNYGFALSTSDRLEYVAMRDPEYRSAIDESRFLHEPASRKGDIYVFGNPITYRFAARHQAIPQQGWSLNIYLPEQWESMADQLASEKPVFVFVAANRQKQIQAHGSQVLSLLKSRYEVARQSPNGTWYEIIHLPDNSVTATAKLTNWEGCYDPRH